MEDTGIISILKILSQKVEKTRKDADLEYDSDFQPVGKQIKMDFQTGKVILIP